MKRNAAKSGRIIILLSVLMLLLLCAFSAQAEDADYQVLADLYAQAVNEETESISDETALGYYQQLVDYYDSMSEQSRAYSNAEYYYYYALGRIRFSKGEYIASLEAFEEHLRNAGQGGDQWLNLDFYCDFCEGAYWLENGDAETALPLFAQAKSENPNAARLCGKKIDECRAMLEKAIDEACVQQDYERAMKYCELIGKNVSTITANELKKRIEAYRANSNIQWGATTAASCEISLSWTGGVPPYTVSWSEDLRESAAMNNTSGLSEKAALLQQLLPGTVYRVCVRDSAGNASEIMTVQTEPAPGYYIGETRIEYTNVSIRAYKPSNYNYTRELTPSTTLYSMQKNFPQYVDRIEGELTVNRAGVSDGSVGYYVTFDTNIPDQLQQLNGQPVRMNLHLEGLGTVSAETGIMGDSNNCVQEYMAAFTIEQILAEGIRQYSPGENVRWRLEILVNGCYIGSVEGKM